MEIQDAVIDPDFTRVLRPPSEQEVRDMADDAKLRGFREPIVAWMNHGLILDGHKRHAAWKILVEEMGEDAPEPEIEEYQFKSEHEAKAWMVHNQLKLKRNLTKFEESELLGVWYNEEKKAEPGRPKSQKPRKNKDKKLGQNDPINSTAEKIAGESGKSEKTVKRAGKFAEAMEKIDAFNAKFAADIRSGSLKLSKQDVIKIGELSNFDLSQAMKNVRAGRPWNHKPNKPAGGEHFDPKQWEPDEKEAASTRKAVEKAHGALVRSLDAYGDAIGKKNEDRHQGLLGTLDEFWSDFEKWK